MKLWNFMFGVLAAMAFLTTSAFCEEMDTMEESTESPIADMAVIDPIEMSSSTERPPAAAASPPVAAMESGMKDDKANSQRHTVGEFIIHPLIAFKPRSPEDTNEAGKQAADGSTTTPSPWQLFGFTAGQGLGSSVTNLAGQVTGWINDRIQLPGLMETPVRESTTTSTTTTTTPRPDVVVRVQHKASTRRPVISITGDRPNRVGDKQDDDNDLDFDDSDEDDDFDEDNNDNDEEEDEDEEDEGDSQKNRKNKKRVQEEEEEEEESIEDDPSNENEEDDEDQEEDQGVKRPNNRRRPAQQNQQINKRRGQQQNRRKNTQRRQGNGGQRINANRRRQQEPEQYDDDDEEAGDIQQNQIFYYGEQPSTKRSQSQANFIQRSQQSLLNQIRQLTRGQTPAEIGAALRKSQRVTTKKQPQQVPLLINRNGQTFFIAPELLEQTSETPSSTPQNLYFPQTTNSKKRNSFNRFPQPPLTTPLKRKGYPPQYITIPWAKLGITQPDNVLSVAEGIQSQPLILNIPQSAIHAMQNPYRKKSQPIITPDAVPLLAEASLMDIFQPPKIPASRTSSTPTASKKEMQTVVLAAKPKSKPNPLPQRIRPATIVEKAPSMSAANESPEEDQTSSNPSQMRTQSENSFIVVGDDNEPGLTRQVQPVWGEQRFYNKARKSYYEILPNGRLIYRQGRSSSQTESEAAQEKVTVPETSATSDLKTESTSDLKTTTPLVEEPILKPVAETEAAAAPVPAAPATVAA